jgi:hypothetical protein
VKDTFNSSEMISFLDLISCGLGAALLLFVIGAAATPVSPPHQNDRSLLIVSRREGGSRAEVGLQWRTPGGAWRRDEEEAQTVSIPSSSDAGGEAVLILRDPPSGTIEVRPYLRAFPAQNQDPEELKTGCRASIDVFGKGASVRTSPPPTPMVWPGRVGQVVEIRIDRPSRR